MTDMSAATVHKIDVIPRLMREHPGIFRGERPFMQSRIPARHYGTVNQLLLEIERIVGDEIGRFCVEWLDSRDGRITMLYRIEDKWREPIDLVQDAGGRVRVIERVAGDPRALIEDVLQAFDAAQRSATRMSLAERLALFDPARNGGEIYS